MAVTTCDKKAMDKISTIPNFQLREIGGNQLNKFRIFAKPASKHKTVKY